MAVSCCKPDHPALARDFQSGDLFQHVLVVLRDRNRLTVALVARHDMRAVDAAGGAGGGPG
jgi:hypothetical protein